MPSYVTREKSGWWRFQLVVPKTLQDIVGKRVISHYIGEKCQRDAEAEGAVLAVQYKAKFARLRSLNKAELQAADEAGGIEFAQGHLWKARQLDEFLDEIHDPRVITAFAKQLNVTPGDIAQMFLQMKANHVAEAPLRAALQSVLAKTTDRPAHTTLADLLDLWQRIRRPKATRKHAVTIREFAKIVGEHADVRTITTDDVAKFRDANAKVPFSMQEKHLKNLKAIFAVAVSERKMSYNAAHGIKPIAPSGPRVVTADGVKPKHPFSGAQLRSILSTAVALGWGGPKRHADAMLALRIMIWTGCRPREACQLRVEDIEHHSGVPCIHFQEVHPEQSVKRDSTARRVPLHNAIADDVLAHAAKRGKGWLFPSFEHRGEDGRGAWFTDAFNNRLLRKHCQITDPKLTLYSTRHRFHDCVRNAGLHPDAQFRLMGHAARDVHDGYGSAAGMAMPILKVAIDRVDPLTLT